MFSVFAKFGFSHKAETMQESSKYVVRIPHADSTHVPEPVKSYRCLNEVFQELIDSQHPLALSKW